MESEVIDILSDIDDDCAIESLSLFTLLYRQSIKIEVMFALREISRRSSSRLSKQNVQNCQK